LAIEIEVCTISIKLKLLNGITNVVNSI